MLFLILLGGREMNKFKEEEIFENILLKLKDMIKIKEEEELKWRE
jgi:hypothetical protein